VTDNPLRTDLLVEPLRPHGGEIDVIELNEETIARFRIDD
jgi:hypothetical protein